MPSAARRMSEIIQYYLARTRGAFQHRQLLDLNALVRETLVLLKPILDQAGVEVTIMLSQSLPLLSGDGASLQRVLLNVLTNAVEQSSESTLTFCTRPPNFCRRCWL